MFGFIKKLFGGIFAFLGGLIGGKKSQDDTSSTPQIAPKTKKGKGYFMELDETGSTKSEATSKPEPVKAGAVAQAKKSEPAQAAVATAPAPKKLEAAAPKKPEPAKAKAEAAEPQNGKVKIEAQANPPAPNNGKAQEATFAPNYLLPKATNSRRRPGPSMDMFRDMARQVKTPG